MSRADIGPDVHKARGGRAQRARLALRLAWRDIREHKGRSFLIIALVMLPVLGMTIAATMTASAIATPEETVAAELGQTQARLVPIPAQNANYEQDPLQPSASMNPGAPDSNFVPAAPQDVIPAGYETLVETRSGVQLFKDELPISMQLVAVDALNPALAGKYELVAGEAPQNDELLVSESALDRLNLSIGDELQTADDGYVVSGVVRQSGYEAMMDMVVVSPNHPLAADIESTPHGYQGASEIYLLGDEPVTWEQVKELNKVGVGAFSRAIILDPPATSMASFADGDSRFVAAMFAVILIGLLALAEISLLSGAAFAVGVKNQRRELALLSASGAEASTVKAVVAASGLLLGGIAALAGTGVGLGVAAIAVAMLRDAGNIAFWGYHVVPWSLVLIVGLGLVSAVLAAVIPGHVVSRQNAFTAVRSAATAQRPPKRTFIAGWIVLGAAVLLGGAGMVLAILSDDPDLYVQRAPIFVSLVAGGAVLFLASLILMIGKIIEVIARLSRNLAPSFRMAARDASRNRSRSAPSVAAVLAATTLAALLMVGAATSTESFRDNYNSTVPEGHGMTPLRVPVAGPPDPTAPLEYRILDANEVERAVETVTGPVESSMVVRNVDNLCLQLEGCEMRTLAIPETNLCPRTDAGNIIDPSDWRCGTTMMSSGMGGVDISGLMIGDARALEKMLGHEPSTEALAALEGGEAVVLNPLYISNGKATIETFDPSQGWSRTSESRAVLDEQKIPAVLATPDRQLAANALMSLETAEAYGLPVAVGGLMVDFATTPTVEQQDEIHQELNKLTGTSYNYMHIERGIPQIQAMWPWIIAGLGALLSLSAAGITAGLALVDGRADHATLAGIGAAPSLRKALAANQTALTASVGGVLGAIAAVVPVAAALTVIRDVELVIPWLPLAALILITPLIGAGAAWLFTRSRLPMAHRRVLQ